MDKGLDALATRRSAWRFAPAGLDWLPSAGQVSPRPPGEKRLPFFLQPTVSCGVTGLTKVADLFCTVKHGPRQELLRIVSSGGGLASGCSVGW